ncbi:dethiobiotin synthase [Phenylobacterium sp.]|uniref:dethiobiotin synthase n=1 Tax=Phenylobacterium sp. TaxID=1871053 RepID=UPI00121933C9|nr:dethiobiotin synthase [Phenylobacterium sp.]THD60224.1 MAG: dethiobiotin synthase [Phenylobacterium sp.]
MPTLFIAGTGTDVGKTYVTASLIRALCGAGVAVEALKPVVSGFDPAAPAGSDPAVLLDALGRQLSSEALAGISPWRYRAPLSPPLAAAREGASLPGAAVIDHCRARSAEAPDGTWLLVESAGGIMSPLDDARTMLDLAAALAAPVLLVAGSYLGTISHTLTAVAVIEAAGLTLAGLMVSETEPDASTFADTVAAIAGRAPQAPVIGLRRGQPMEPAMLEALGLV